MANKLWSDEELRDSVLAYIDMQNNIAMQRAFTKKAVYKKLSEKWGRTEKSYERRMGNISSVLALHGRFWIKGLKPLSNVGTNVTSVIEKYLNEFEGISDNTSVAFEVEVANKVKSKFFSIPIGNQTPSRKKTSVNLFERDSDVKAWLLKNANGNCECCENKAPFISILEVPYLEVHHLVRLADLGLDCVSNAVAVCPNCHRALHYSIEKSALYELLYSKVKRLVKLRSDFNQNKGF